MRIYPTQSASPALAPHLFIDIDGVLQTPKVHGWQQMEHCNELRALVMRHPHLRLVLSSSHREGKTLVDAQRLFPADIRSQLIGMTPIHAHGRANGGRQREIEEWLTHNAPGADWVAVDDEHRLFEPESPKLVTTHPLVGWDEHTTDSVIRELELGYTQTTKTGIFFAEKANNAQHRWRPSTKLTPRLVR